MQFTPCLAKNWFTFFSMFKSAAAFQTLAISPGSNLEAPGLPNENKACRLFHSVLGLTCNILTRCLWFTLHSETDSDGLTVFDGCGITELDGIEYAYYYPEEDTYQYLYETFPDVRSLDRTALFCVSCSRVGYEASEGHSDICPVSKRMAPWGCRTHACYALLPVAMCICSPRTADLRRWSAVSECCKG